jgi:hypothetical protein
MKKHKKKKQIFHWGQQHTLQIIGCITSLKIHFCLRRTTIRNNNLIFFFIFFREGKEKKIVTISSHYSILDLPNYISTCYSNNLHTNVVHPNLTFSSLVPTTTPSPRWNFHFDHPWQHHYVFFPTKQGQGEDHEASWEQNLHCWYL